MESISVFLIKLEDGCYWILRLSRGEAADKTFSGERTKGIKEKLKKRGGPSINKPTDKNISIIITLS